MCVDLALKFLEFSAGRLPAMRKRHEARATVRLSARSVIVPQGPDHLSENSVSRTFPFSPMMHTSVCGFVVFVRST